MINYRRAKRGYSLKAGFLRRYPLVLFALCAFVFCLLIASSGANLLGRAGFFVMIGLVVAVPASIIALLWAMFTGSANKEYWKHRRHKKRLKRFNKNLG